VIPARRTTGWRKLLAPGAVLALALAGPTLAPAGGDLEGDPAGARYLPPFTRAFAVPVGPDETWIVTELTRNDGGWHGRHAGQEVDVPARPGRGDPRARLFLLGTDELGRDLAPRLLRGARRSVAIACGGVALAMAVGFVVGSSAGLGSRRRDTILMRATDVVLAMPRVLVYLLCACLFGPSTVLVVLLLGLTTWPGLARLVRAGTQQFAGSEAFLAARAAGCAPGGLFLRHLLPALSQVVAVTAMLRFADAILLEAALSFLGVGSPPPAVSLGGIAASGRDALSSAWWIVAWPGLAIALLVLSVRTIASRLAPSSPSSVGTDKLASL
jgi:peptide/nickel transport system permease protein